MVSPSAGGLRPTGASGKVHRATIVVAGFATHTEVLLPAETKTLRVNDGLDNSSQ